MIEVGSRVEVTVPTATGSSIFTGKLLSDCLTEAVFIEVDEGRKVVVPINRVLHIVEKEKA